MNKALPTIEHSAISLNKWNRVVVQMDEGYAFWDRNDYRDENGEMYEPTPNEKGYSRFGVFSLERDFSLFVVVAETDIPEISETPEEPEEPTIPEQPESETQATEEDYINALEELGVTFDE